MDTEKMREAFEAEMRCEETWGHQSLKRKKCGRYEHWRVDLMWSVWQAALTHPQDPASVGGVPEVDDAWIEGAAEWHLGRDQVENIGIGNVKAFARALLTAAPQAPADAPVWVEGRPANLAAAAKDADEWLALIQRLNDAGHWKFSEPDSRARLDGCRAALAAMSTKAGGV